MLFLFLPMKIIFRYVFILLILAFNSAMAQSFVTKVSSKTIGKKDLLEVQYVAENLELSDFLLPKFSGWSVQSGPEFRSNRIQSGNLVKQQIIYSILLQPLRTGKLSVPSATIVIDRNTSRRSNTITVEVKNVEHVAGNIQGAAPVQQQPDPLPNDFTKDQLIRRGENPAAKVKGNLFVKLEVNKSSSFVGEPILATYKLYTRLRSQSRAVKQPAFNGATVVEMTPEEAVPKQERLNGRLYNVYIIRRVQLFPLQAGKLVLPQTNIENKVTFYKAENLNYRDLYYNPSNLPVEEQTVTLLSSSASVDVKPLPPAPAGFNGAVGKFKIATGLAGNKPVSTNNTAGFIAQIEGPGNLQQIRAPQILWPAGVEGFDPTDEEEADKSTFPVTVKKTFKYPFLVTKVGSYTVPPVEFVYFDPYVAKYVTLRSKPYSFSVVQSQNVSVSKFNFKDKFGFETHLAVILGAGLLAIFIGLFIFSRRQRKTVVAVPVVAQPVQVKEPAQVYVDSEQFIHYIRHSDPVQQGPDFYKQLHKNISSYLYARFNIPVDDLDAFAKNHPEEITLMRLKNLLNESNLAMYTPLYNMDAALNHRLEAITLLSKLEKV